MAGIESKSKSEALGWGKRRYITNNPDLRQRSKSNLRKEQIYPPRPQKPAKIARNVPCGTELSQSRKRREKSR